MTFPVRKPGQCGPGTQVFHPTPWPCPLTAALWPVHRLGRKQMGPWLQPAPSLMILTLGRRNSHGGLNKRKLIAGDNFGPDCDRAQGGDGGDICLATGLFINHADLSL